ncbi:MAG: tRNA uridine-5-carboxymethylaminomethyl(34) synthesis enzyme MnmG, partial [Candidatus Omnitrophica bacterium]|nr:tRNA uridine-5-carboxymethylaminomethyl(34) synthesis enzyme MnmG [Candidatus Omnitrophota bacterium]
IKRKRIEEGLRALMHKKLYPTIKTNNRLKKMAISPISNVLTMFDLLKRPEVDFDTLMNMDGLKKKIGDEEIRQIEIEVKYKGFIERQKREIENFKRIEKIRIPDDFKFYKIPGLSNEISEKLTAARPISLGHASRISGVTPVAISILMVYLKRWREDRWKKRQ